MLAILDLLEFRKNVEHKEEIREAIIAENMTSFCYMVAEDGTFDTAFLRECRGIVFNTETNQVIGRPLHKFFNLNERVETQTENVDWTKVTRVMDKRDGSMIHSVATADGFALKSKKSFTSDVALAADAWVRKPENDIFFKFIQHVVADNCTAIFEWTAPDARIVLLYSTPELQLLHVRNNLTGEYMRADAMKDLAARYGIKCVAEVQEFWTSCNGQKMLDVKAMMEAAEHAEGIEGWVLQFENGDMIKIKTKWYLIRHHAMTFLRERDIAILVLEEGLDDVKSLLVSERVDISEILGIESTVVADLNHARHWVEGVIAKDGKMDRKDFAIKYSQSHSAHGWFGLVMTRYQGKEPDYKAWYIRHVLKQKWQPRTLVLLPTSADVE